MKEENLIFIVSQPRSGSTYVQNLLSNNSVVNTCSEPWILLNFVSLLKPELIQAGYNPTMAQKAFSDYLSKYPETDWKLKLKHYILELYQPMATGYNLVIDKTPRYWELLDELQTLFPKSKILIIKRHPFDVLKSIIKTFDLKTIADLNKFRRDILVAPKRIQEFCDQQRTNTNVRVVTYEAIVTNPEKEVQALYDWAAIPYTSEVLHVETNEKYKGAFGDPFQNATEEKANLREQFKKKTIPVMLEEIMAGYEYYLSPKFLKTYGNYEPYLLGEETKAFNTFLKQSQNPQKLQKEVAAVKNSKSYRIGKTLLTPFHFIKKLLK